MIIGSVDRGEEDSIFELSKSNSNKEFTTSSTYINDISVKSQVGFSATMGGGEGYH